VAPQPLPGQAGDPRLQPLIDHLAQHKDRINIEALRKQLIEPGHDPVLVAEACVVVIFGLYAVNM
jgi:hypothetical protein